MKPAQQISFFTGTTTTAVSAEQAGRNLHSKKQGSVVTEEKIDADKPVDKSNLSPGRLARPLKKKKYN